jgi:hypothetical protein
MDLQRLIGKTITSATKLRLGDDDGHLRIRFSDGSTFDISSGASGDGSYLDMQLTENKTEGS